MSATELQERRADSAQPDSFTRSEKLVLGVLLGAGFMLSVDFSVLNVALPDVGRDLGMTAARLQWVPTACALPSAGLSLVLGRLADLRGRRRLFLLGMVLMAAASTVGGFATTSEVLLTARVAQGVATAMSGPAALSLVTSTFAEGTKRDRALGLNAALLSGGFTVGALLGGTLVDVVSWRAAFFINLPVALVVLVLGRLVLVESTTPSDTPLDMAGGVTVTAGLLGLTYGATEYKPWLVLVGLVLLGVFWLIEARATAPLAPLRILRSASVVWGNVASLVVFAVEPAMIFLMTLYLQDVLHLSPFATGLVFGIPGLGSVGAGIVAGRLLGRHGQRVVLVCAVAVQGLSIAPLLVLGDQPWALVVMVPALFVGFFAHVAAIVATTATATSGLDTADHGLASGLVSMTQRVGITIGTPLLSALTAAQADFLTGERLALGSAVLLTTTTAVLVWHGLRRSPAP